MFYMAWPAGESSQSHSHLEFELSSSLIEGVHGGLRQRVGREIKAHLRENRAIRRARAIPLLNARSVF
jgi:hypothetical protein